MTTKFKVGDTVRITSHRDCGLPGNSDVVAVGSTGIVTQATDEDFFIGEWCYRNDCAELVEEPTTVQPEQWIPFPVDSVQATEALAEDEIALSKVKPYDMIEPKHYTEVGISPLEVIELNTHLTWSKGNAVKYILRAGLKPGNSEIQDLEKALWYLTHEIERIKGE